MEYRPFKATVAPSAEQDRIGQQEVRLTEEYGGSFYMPFSAVTPVVYSGGGGRVLNGELSPLTRVCPGGEVDWYALLGGGASMHIGVRENLKVEVQIGALEDRMRVNLLREELADMV